MLQVVLSVPLAVVGLFLGSFLFSSITEREKRASTVSAILFIAFLSLWLWTEYEWRAGRQLPLILTSIFSLGALVAFFLPARGKSARQTERGTDGSIVRVDERDVVFSRSELVKGTADYEEYYRAHPELKTVDESFCSVSELEIPGQEMYSDQISPLTHSASEFLKRNITLVDGPVEKRKQDLGAERASRLVKLAALRLGAEDVGIAPLDSGFMYSHVGRGPEPRGSEIHTSHSWAICFTVQMDHDIVRGAPSPWNTVETHSRYAQVSRIGVILAAWLRALGYGARAHVPGSNYQVLLPPLASLCGLGEMGRIGIMVSHSFGPRVRLGAVTTEMPLVPDPPQKHGVEEFCMSCLKCATNCPAGAIPMDEPRENRGVVKWTISPEKCFKYWCTLGNDCGICLRVCPFSKPDTLVHEVIRSSIKLSSLGRRIAVKADDLFYGKRPEPIVLPPLAEM